MSLLRTPRGLTSTEECRVVIDEIGYVRLLFLPLIWVNVFTDDEPIEEFELALERVLGKTNS